MFIWQMLAHYFLNWSGVRDQKFITRYWDLSYHSIVKCWVRKSILILVAYFFKGEAVWAMKHQRCYCIFDQMLTKARNDMEVLLKCFWQSIPMVLFTKENFAYRDMLTYKSENLLKNPITMLLLFLIQLSRKMHRT